MTKKRRWIETALRESGKTRTPMPWERGARRAAWIAKREAPAIPRRASA